MKVSERGEFGFIDDIKSNTIFNPATIVQGIGDDTAVYRVTEGYDQLITTDMMVNGIHFSEVTTIPFDVGYRLGAANIRQPCRLIRKLLTWKLFMTDLNPFVKNTT